MRARCGLLTVFVMLVTPGVMSAQSTRDTLRAAHQAYDDFNNPVALRLYRAGLSPNGGPADSLWALGLFRFARLQMETGRNDEALQWLRWGVRHNPAIPVDSSFPPAFLETFENVRSQVELQRPTNAVAATSWDWTPAFDPTAVGRITVGSADSLAVATALVVGVGVVPLEGRELSPGTYTIQVSAPGYADAEFHREVLPGIATNVRVRLRDNNPALLYVGSNPWGTVYVNNERIGYTMLSAHPLISGDHNISITRPGYAPFETTVSVVRGQRLRLGTIQLIPSGNR